MDKTKQEQLGEYKAGRRHTVAEMEAELARYRASGLTQAEFTTREGLRASTLRNWQYRVGRGKARAEQCGVVGFARVHVREARASAITLRWPQGVEMELAVDLDGSGVVRLVRDLLGPCLR